MGRRGPKPIHPDREARDRAINKARNRAYVMLSNRYWDEFVAIKNELLAEMGELPLDETRMSHRKGLM